MRNDVAYLRRPGQTSRSDATTEDDTTVKNVNSLIQRVAGTSLGEIENLIRNWRACATFCTPKASACSARSPATPTSATPP